MKIAICEDHMEEALWLKNIIEEWAVNSYMDMAVNIYENTSSFLFSKEDVIYDALFLDIQMPGEDGITLAKKLRAEGNDIPIVFATGIDTYISQGYEVEAVHYLLKPVNKEKVWECLERICIRLRQSAGDYLILDTEDGIVKLSQSDIFKIEVFGRKCVYTLRERKYTVSGSFKEAASKVNSSYFVQCYRGILVNVYHIESIGHDKIYLDGNIEVPVSRRMYADVNKAFISFFRKENIL